MKSDADKTPMQPQKSGDPEIRFDVENDWMAQQFFSPADLQMSPEEYAARHAHALGCFSFHRYRYRDAALAAWIRRLGEIFSDADELARCQERYLTPDELAEVHRQETEAF